MDSAPIQMVVNIFAAVGFTVTGIIIKGMILYGAWLFFVIAVIGVFMTIFNNIEERDAFFHVIKKFASISIAVLLFYIPIKVNLADVVAGVPKSDVSSAVSGNGLISSMANFSSGSNALVNAFTYYAYEWSSGFPALATEIAGTSSTYIWPGVESAIDADLSGAMQSNDPQIAANMAQWKYILAPAILKSDPALASALQTNPMLQYVYDNPYSTTTATDPRYGAYAAQVKALLSSDLPKPTFQSIVLQNQAALAKIARKFGSVVPFTATPSSTAGASPSSVSVKLFSKEFWIENQKIDANNAANNVESGLSSNTASDLPGGSRIWSFINWLPSLGERLTTTSAQRQQISTNDSATAAASSIAVDMTDFFGGSQFNNPTQTFTSLGNLYQNLGRSVLVASVMGYADNPKAMSAMAALCKTHGNAACTQTLQMFSNQQRRPDDAVGHTPGVSSWLGKTLSDLGSFTITGLIEVVIYSIGTIFNTAAPYIIAVCMAAAILVSVIGPIWMLMAGRFLHAIEWMIFPVILVNLWDALYIIWIIVCDALDDVIPHLAGTVNNGSPVGQNVGIVANPALMNHIVNIFEAMGFLAIPTAAYILLFGKAADGLRSNFGGAMARSIGTAATLAAMTAMRSMTKGGKKASGTGKQAPGGKGITQGMATNAPSGGGSTTAAASTAAKAVGGAPAKGNAAHNISGSAPQKSDGAQNSATTKIESSGGTEGGGATESSGSKGTGQNAVTSNQATATPSVSSQPSTQGGGAAPDSHGPSSGGQVTSNQTTATPSASSQPSIQGGGTAPDSRGRPTGGSIAGSQSVTGPQGRGSAPQQAAPQNTAATSNQPQPYQQQRPSIVANQPKSAGKRSTQKPAVTGRITGYNPKKSS